VPLGSPPPFLRRVRPGHWQSLDAVAAAGYAVVVLLVLLNESSGPAGFLAAPIGVLAFAGPIVLRRRRPIMAVLLVLAGLGVVGLIEPRSSVLGLVPLAYVLYAVAAGARPRTAVIVLAVSLAAALSTALPDLRHTGAAVLFSLVYTTVWTAGYAVGLHRRYTGDLLQKQARLAEAELEDARRGVTEERMRIARELHDVVAHSMSVITVQASYGALVIDQNPDEARAALGAIEATGRLGMAELRQLLDVLREDPADRDGAGPPLAPAPGLADLDRLVRQTAGAGVRVDVTVTGRPRALPPGIDLSAYRILQEALTNVVRHAGTAAARLSVDYREDELVVVVTDGGRGCAGHPHPGHGLVGMRERARLHGGSFQAMPLPDQGFQVTGRLPLPAGARAEPAAGARAEPAVGSRAEPAVGSRAGPPVGGGAAAPEDRAAPPVEVR
jgi:signal transduction histidine kinase